MWVFHNTGWPYYEKCLSIMFSSAAHWQPCVLSDCHHHSCSWRGRGWLQHSHWSSSSSYQLLFLCHCNGCQYLHQPPSPAFQYQMTSLSHYIWIWQDIPGCPNSILALWCNLNHHCYLNFQATSQEAIEELMIFRSFCKGHCFPCWKNYTCQCCYWYARFHQSAYWHFWEIHDKSSCWRPCHYLLKLCDGIGAGVWQWFNSWWKDCIGFLFCKGHCCCQYLHFTYWSWGVKRLGSYYTPGVKFFLYAGFFLWCLLCVKYVCIFLFKMVHWLRDNNRAFFFTLRHMAPTEKSWMWPHISVNFVSKLALRQAGDWHNL